MTPILTPAISTVLLRTQSDEKLVALVAAGHERAFEALCDRHRPALARSLRRIMPPSRVDDALQQTFLSAWTALAGGTEVRAVVPWLHRIARNAASTALARPGYDHAELEEALHLTPGPEEDLERRDVVRRTLRGVAALPERQREALLAVAVEGRPHAQVAAELGMTEPAVRQLVRRARTSLRTAVGAIVPTPLISWALTAGGHVATADGVAGAAIGAGGTSVVATALKIGAVVAAVSTPVVHHAVTTGGHHAPARPAVAMIAAGSAGARALPAGASPAATAAARAAAHLRAATGSASTPGAGVTAAGAPPSRLPSRARAHLPAGSTGPVTLPAAAALPATMPHPAPAALPVHAALPATASRQHLTMAQWLTLLAMQQRARRTTGTTTAPTSSPYGSPSGRRRPDGDRWPTGGGTTTTTTTSSTTSAPAPAPSPATTTGTATTDTPATTTGTSTTTSTTSTTASPASTTTTPRAAPPAPAAP
ncbi:sigma-70 family RNA polymerase sigma factor [Paraconexibacter antarcticus]|uniref:Sigma-70 family RNA polymerase sigma factor n=1 Tax=Paraconexibacter antarcticus TaxID=2949664 RepID=A0ABY5DKV8_9ACTN|nr:sigma-70 family RNA polymerase sigma factor [Paraconexibacter antarcticus]UTI62388.1 sigma-70 family RNA polymerase sigma factor [Paraconexibacter antarcticus]